MGTWPPKELLCKVDVAHENANVIVVSVEIPGGQDGGGMRRFQGALIDITNGSLGTPPSEATLFAERLRKDNPKDFSEESFLTNRHTYFNDAKQKRKLKVRLRARQILCNQCRHVCRETGERVRKRPRYKISAKRYAEAVAEAKRKTMVPRLKRLSEREVKKHFHSIKPLKIRLMNPSRRNSTTNGSLDETAVKVSLNNDAVGDKSDGKNLRRNRIAVGAMEDLWDEDDLIEGRSKKINLSLKKSLSTHIRIISPPKRRVVEEITLDSD